MSLLSLAAVTGLAGKRSKQGLRRDIGREPLPATRSVQADESLQERMIKGSDFDWTIARPPRSLSRKLHASGVPKQHEALPPNAGSAALTVWLLRELKAEADVNAELERGGRLGSARTGIAEPAALFVAQGKRIALEAHRFADL